MESVDRVLEAAATLREDALAANERRVLVLAGTPQTTREVAAQVLDATGIDLTATTYFGPGHPLECERLDPTRAGELLGATREAIVLDCHERFEPNALGRLVGTVAGGGLLVLATPPLDSWPETRDDFDATLAVPPFERAAVTGHFRQRFVETLCAHRGVAIVDVDDRTVECDGLAPRAPRLARDESGATDPPEDGAFPTAAYDACLTADQRDALAAFERLLSDGTALVVESDRGRGKSSVAGLAAASLSLAGHDVLVTAPQYRSARELFARAAELLDALGERENDGDEPRGSDAGDAPRHLDAGDGEIRFRAPAVAVECASEYDRVIVDEAAALPVGLLDSFLDADGAAFTTTVHGYEGAGRGFSVRFRDHLDESPLAVTDVTLTTPIRHAPADPIEVWSFRALALDARPPVDPLVADATPDSVTYRELSSAELRADENLLREVFGLLVLAHYRTEPNDLARLLDAPNVSVHALFAGEHPVSVALLAREGGLSAETRADIYEGGAIRGNLIPDLLGSQLRDEAAAELVGHRVLRIATHSAARSRGLGSALLSRLRDRCESDWLGVGFGATPQLVAFWRENGFRTVHLGTSRDERSGEHSAVMLVPLSEAGHELQDRHSSWFLRRLPGTLADALAELDPDVVRAVCRATAGTPPLDLTEFEWRVAAGIPHGAAFTATAPRAVRRLALRHLVDPAADGLSAREERVLVLKPLQCRPWEEVAEVVSAESVTACRRTLGGAVERLVELYGDETALRDLERHR